MRRRSKQRSPLKITEADLESDYDSKVSYKLTEKFKNPGVFGIAVEGSRLSGSFKSQPKQSSPVTPQKSQVSSPSSKKGFSISNFKLGLSGTAKDIVTGGANRRTKRDNKEVLKAPQFEEEFSQEEQEIMKRFMPDFDTVVSNAADEIWQRFDRDNNGFLDKIESEKMFR